MYSYALPKKQVYRGAGNQSGYGGHVVRLKKENMEYHHIIGNSSYREPINSFRGQVIQRVRIENTTQKPMRFDFATPEMKDDEYVYLYHGTYAAYLGLNSTADDTISKIGLDPSKGGTGGSSERERGLGRGDSRGRMKYATDPQTGLIYAMEAANHEQVGVLLEAKVRISDITDSFISPAEIENYLTNGTAFWAKETGGEGFFFNDRINHLNKKLHPFFIENNIKALETNVLIPSKDIRIISFCLPKETQIETSDYLSLFGQQDAVELPETEDLKLLLGEKNPRISQPPPQQQPSSSDLVKSPETENLKLPLDEKNPRISQPPPPLQPSSSDLSTQSGKGRKKRRYPTLLYE